MLQWELHTQQERHREFRRQTINAMEQAPIPIHLDLKDPLRFMVLIRRILTAGWTK